MFLFEEKVKPNRYIYSGIVELSSESEVLVLVNNGNSSIQIQPGEIIGFVFSVVRWVLEISGEALSLASDGGDVAVSEESIAQVVLGDHLSSSEQDRVMEMLESRQDFFSRGSGDVRCFGVTQHRIELYDYTPIYQRPRRFPEVVNEEIEEQCKELKLLDIIEPSSSPAVPIRKKDGTIRLCIDYRRFNDVTKPDKHPIPNLNDAVFGLSGVQKFSSKDLVRGYYQLPLGESSRESTAFSTARAHWQFKGLSFGLKNAHAGFQREMKQILNCFSWRKVIVYIDDVLVMGDTFDEHLDLVVEAIDKFTLHETVRQLRSFLGLVNFQRKFVPNCSVVMKPEHLTGGKASAKINGQKI